MKLVMTLLAVGLAACSPSTVFVSSYRPPTDLWARRQALVRSVLGVPAAQEASGVLEVKRRGAIPGWLVDCLVAIGVRPIPFSKFVTVARAVEAHA